VHRITPPQLRAGHSSLAAAKMKGPYGGKGGRDAAFLDGG
jgi:hypothetical protein